MMRRFGVLLAALLGGLLLIAATPKAPLTDADGFRLAVPPYTYRFPADHAAHRDYRIEWWYYTGHLHAGARRFGYELTFFRVGVPGVARSRSAWRTNQILFRHLALTDEQGRRFLSDERSERQALGLAGADTAAYRVWIGDERAGLEPDGRTHRLVARADAFTFDLALVPEKPPAIHGEGGVSQKSAGVGNASHYYSYTRLATRGRLVLGRDTLAVEGRSWMDHEFSSDRLSATHAGWDWFSVQLDDGTDLMLYQLRLKSGGIEPNSSGTLIAADGRTRRIAREGFTIGSRGTWRSPHTGGVYPSSWTVSVPGERLELRLEPVLADQELVVRSMGGIAYWEGAVRITGTHAGRPVSGQGYVELTGYTGRTPF